MANRRKNIYCVKCGIKNNIDHKRCKKCNTKLDQKDHLLFHYLKGEAISNIEDTAGETLFESIKTILIKHLYGIVLGASVIFTTTALIVNALSPDKNQENIIVVDKKLKLSNLCQFDDSVSKKSTCPDGFVLQEDTCLKITKTSAKVDYTCDAGYEYVNGTCVSMDSFPSNKRYWCDLPRGWTTSTKDVNGVLHHLTVNDIWYVHCSNKDPYRDDRSECTSASDGCSAGYCFPGSLVNDEAGLPYFDGTRKDCLDGGSIRYSVTLTETCPIGTTMINGTCRKTANAYSNYSCDDGKLNGQDCEKEERQEPVLACPDGYQFDVTCNICVKED